MKKRIKIKFLLKPEIFTWVSDYIISILNNYYDVELTDNPDYVFVGSEDFRQVQYDCVRIVMIGENQRPDFNICDYAIGFDHIHFEDRYARFPLYFLYKETINEASVKHLNIEDSFIKAKSGFCNFVVSNAKADDNRVNFFDQLSLYKKVDSGGKFRNNVGGPVADKFEFQKRYKFSICFENSSTSGYLTEKIFQAFAAKTIPIYWGDINISKSIQYGGSGVHPDAFVNIHEFDSFEEAIKRIIVIDQNDQLFLKMLQTPVFDDDEHIILFEKKLTTFLLNIFEQPVEKAYRRGFGQFRNGIENKLKRAIDMKNTKYLIHELLRRIKF